MGKSGNMPPVMTSSKPPLWVRVVVVAACALGVALAPLGQGQAYAAPLDRPARPQTPSTTARPGGVDLRLGWDGARRVAMADEGAAQEGDTEKPRDMHTASTQPPPQQQPLGTTAAKAGSPNDPYAFLKDWPFWVIAGGVVVAGVAGYMIYANANQESPCSPRFDQGCFGER